MIEPQFFIRKAVADSLTAGEFRVIADLSNSEGLVELVSELKPQMVISEVSMSGYSPLTSLTYIKRADKHIKFVFFTEIVSDNYVFEAMKRGADGYVTKGDADFLSHLVKINNGEKYLSPEALNALVTVIGRNGKTTTSSRMNTLTRREAEIVKLIGEGLASKAIANKLGLSYKTVESHVYSTLRKLGLSHRTGLVRYALENGLVRFMNPDAMVPNIIPND